MTGLSIAKELRLPHRRHELFPPDVRDRREWAVENAVWLFTETGETSLLDMVRVFRPDLDAAQVLEKVKLLCWLSEQVEDWSLADHRRAADAAVEDYEAALVNFAAQPATFTADADLALAIVTETPTPAPADELAARRGAHT